MNNGRNFDKKDSVLRSKSYAFGVRIVMLSQFLITDDEEYVLSKQVLRSGTSIGVLIRETVKTSQKN
ncbi:MAG: four helix bundle protein [Blastocatellia bacterium]